MTPEIYRSLAQGLLGQATPAPAPAAEPFHMVTNQQMAADQLNKLPLSNQRVAEVAPAVQAEAGKEDIKAQALESLAAVNKSRIARGQTPVTPEMMAEAGKHVVGAANPEIGSSGAIAGQPVDIDESALTTDLSYDGVKRDDNGVPMSPQSLLQDIETNQKLQTQDANRVASMRRRGEADALKTDHDIAVASQKPEDELHKRIEDNYNNLANVQKEVDEHAQNAITEYKNVNAEMMKIAQASPKDLFEQAGVNRISGIAAIFFGGFGVNGNHANHNLELINNMADRNVAQEKAKFERMQAVGEGDKTLYGMLQQRLQNAQAVSGTMKNMATEAYLSQLRSIANQYADPKYKAAVEKQAAVIEQDRITALRGVEKTATDEKQNALRLIGAENARATVQALNQQKLESYKIKGYTGHAINAKEHGELSKVVAGGRGMIEALNHMEAMINAGATVASIREYMTESAGLFKGARDYLETGTRIEEGEQKIINQLMIAPGEAVASSYFGNLKDGSGVITKISGIRHMIREGMDQKVLTYSPDMAPDEKDSLTGGLLDKNLSSEEKLNPGGKNQGLLDSLPNADGSKPYQPTQVIAGGY